MKTLISANYQAHATAIIRNEIKMLGYTMHHHKDSLHLKTKTEQRGSTFCNEPLALQSKRQSGTTLDPVKHKFWALQM